MAFSVNPGNSVEKRAYVWDSNNKQSRGVEVCLQCARDSVYLGRSLESFDIVSGDEMLDFTNGLIEIAQARRCLVQLKVREIDRAPVVRRQL